MDKHMARGSNRGFTYLGLLILIAILAITSAAIQTAGAVAQRVDAELDLLKVGQEFRKALASYYQETPSGKLAYPTTLADLLEDPRHTAKRRHLRSIPIDPMTGKREWGLVWSGDRAGIVAVYSLSPGVPIKAAGFPLELRHFAGQLSYSAWRFGYFVDGAVPMPVTNTSGFGLKSHENSKP
jgi:type II secretory pathway pseudopilin PulG